MKIVKNIKYMVCFFATVAHFAVSCSANREVQSDRRSGNEVVAIFQGACSLLHQQPSRFSALATVKNNEDLSYQKSHQIVQLFKPFTCLQGEYSFQITENGREYKCESPIISAVSQYVSHYDRFLGIVEDKHLGAFGFTGELANKNKCPFVSFTTKNGTARKYGIGVADPNFVNVKEFPHYDEHGAPSQSRIGSIMVALLTADMVRDHNQFLYVDVKNEQRLELGQTKARRLDQDEICVIGRSCSSHEI